MDWKEEVPLCTSNMKLNYRSIYVSIEKHAQPAHLRAWDSRILTEGAQLPVTLSKNSRASPGLQINPCYATVLLYSKLTLPVGKVFNDGLCSCLRKQI